VGKLDTELYHCMLTQPQVQETGTDEKKIARLRFFLSNMLIFGPQNAYVGLEQPRIIGQFIINLDDLNEDLSQLVTLS
jgi:hypothetical protein